MSNRKEVHGIVIGDIWNSNEDSCKAAVEDIQVACSGKVLIFYELDNGEKLILFADDFCSNYYFLERPKTTKSEEK